MSTGCWGWIDLYLNSNYYHSAYRIIDLFLLSFLPPRVWFFWEEYSRNAFAGFGLHLLSLSACIRSASGSMQVFFSDDFVLRNELRLVLTGEPWFKIESEIELHTSFTFEELFRWPRVPSTSSSRLFVAFSSFTLLKIFDFSDSCFATGTCFKHLEDLRFGIVQQRCAATTFAVLWNCRFKKNIPMNREKRRKKKHNGRWITHLNPKRAGQTILRLLFLILQIEEWTRA